MPYEDLACVCEREKKVRGEREGWDCGNTSFHIHIKH